MNEELIQFFQEVKFTLETRKERLVDRKIQKIKREGAVLVPLIVMPSVKKIEEIYQLELEVGAVMKFEGLSW